MVKFLVSSLTYYSLIPKCVPILFYIIDAVSINYNIIQANSKARNRATRLD